MGKIKHALSLRARRARELFRKKVYGKTTHDEKFTLSMNCGDHDIFVVAFDHMNCSYNFKLFGFIFGRRICKFG